MKENPISIYFVYIFVLSLALLSLTTAPAEAAFKVIVKIDNVNSFSDKHLIKVSLSDGHSKSKTKDLGKLADIADDSLVQLTFKFKNVPIYTSFTACVDKTNCEEGINTPAKRPEVVKLWLD